MQSEAKSGDKRAVRLGMGVAMQTGRRRPVQMSRREREMGRRGVAASEWKHAMLESRALNDA
jgi:hypothetical protein